MVKKLLMAGLLLAVSPSAFAGTISMSSTPYPDSVVVEVTVDDTGGHPECTWLAITRATGVHGSPGDVAYFERQMGVTSTHRFVDMGVEPNTLYCYGMDLRFAPAIPCFVGGLCDVFDCFYQIMTCVNTGPDPAFMGRGLLSAKFPDGSPVDDNEVRALLYECGGPDDDFFGLHIIPGDAQQYLDSGTEVDVFGTWWCCWAQGVWLLQAQAVVPHACVIPVEETTWGRVKSFYRD